MGTELRSARDKRTTKAEWTTYGPPFLNPAPHAKAREYRQKSRNRRPFVDFHTAVNSGLISCDTCCVQDMGVDMLHPCVGQIVLFCTF